MSRTLLGALVLAAAGMAAFPRPAAAQQTVSLNIGYFAVRGEDGRVEDDVLVENLDFLAFDLKDFNGLTVGGDWLAGIGEYFEAGVGISFYRRTVPSVYADFVKPGGGEIEQDLKLRIIPITATVRVLPLGRSNPIQLYVGGGLGIFNWRYSETGEFVDLRDFSIFRETYVADGTDYGPVAVAGLRFPVGDQFSIGGELRYDVANGTVGVENGFLGDKIDLGGYTAQATFAVKF